MSKRARRSARRDKAMLQCLRYSIQNILLFVLDAVLHVSIDVYSFETINLNMYNGVCVCVFVWGFCV